MPRNQQVMVCGPNPGSCLVACSPGAESPFHFSHRFPFNRPRKRLCDSLISPLGAQRVTKDGLLSSGERLLVPASAFSRIWV